MLRHELVELFLVLGVAQAIEEIAEFGLLLFEAPQRFHAVFVEGAIAARGRTETAEVKPRRSMWLRIRSILYCIRSILFCQRS